MTAVTIGVLTIHDLVEHAVTNEGKPLMRVSLRRLLLASPDYTMKQADHVLNHLCVVLGLPDDEVQKKFNVQWLLDERSGGRRFAAWMDAVSPRDRPWAGWPATPQPNQRTTSL